MAAQEDFNAVDWQTLTDAPAVAGLIVVTAQRGGTIRESIAMAKAYAQAKADHDHELIGAIAAKAPQVDPKQFTSKEDLHTSGLHKIGEAVALLDGTASADEIEAYKQFTLSVAQRAAEADKSGGVLGIGGERVSDSERAALAEIAAALGTEPPAEGGEATDAAPEPSAES